MWLLIGCAPVTPVDLALVLLSDEARVLVARALVALHEGRALGAHGGERGADGGGSAPPRPPTHQECGRVAGGRTGLLTDYWDFVW